MLDNAAKAIDHEPFPNVNSNPYAPPVAEVADVPAAVDSQQTVPPFFAVSALKLAVLSICSMGLYELYWFYKNWQLIRAREGSKIVPAARAVFGVLFCYSCFKRIRDHGKKLGIEPSFAAGALATGWAITTVAWKLPDPYWLVTLVAFLFLLPVQTYVNRINVAEAPDNAPNARFTAWNWILIVLGGSLLFLGILGTFIGPPGK